MCLWLGRMDWSYPSKDPKGLSYLSRDRKGSWCPSKDLRETSSIAVL